MRACARNRGRRSATRYHDSLKTGCVTPALRSWEPGPEPQAEPFRGLMRPDPHQLASPGVDLRDALGTGQQPRRLALERGFDAEAVAALLGRRDGHDLAHLERER